MSNWNKATRTILRSTHLVMAFLIGVFIYSPARDSEAFVLLVQVAVVPAAALTGVWMWQQARVRRLYGRIEGGNR